MSILYVIPARGGSKGIPGKNIKPFNGKPLICHSIDVAKQVAGEKDVICVSTDDDAIIKTVEAYGLRVDFKRPETLATDTAGTYEVLLHALEFYEQTGFRFDKVVLLQPTSPFREAWHITEALAAFTHDLDMVVSVKETRSNPYYTLAEENEAGFLVKSKPATFTRRQDCPAVYEYNGAVYIINTESLKKQPLHLFSKVKKYVMAEEVSFDLDTVLDWKIAECMAKNNKI